MPNKIRPNYANNWNLLCFFRVIHTLDRSGKFQKKSRSCISWFVGGCWVVVVRGVWWVVGGASLCNCAGALRGAHSLSTDTKQRAERIRASALALALDNRSDHPLLAKAGWQTGTWITAAYLYCKMAVSVLPVHSFRLLGSNLAL